MYAEIYVPNLFWPRKYFELSIIVVIGGTFFSAIWIGLILTEISVMEDLLESHTSDFDFYLYATNIMWNHLMAIKGSTKREKRHDKRQYDSDSYLTTSNTCSRGPPGFPGMPGEDGLNGMDGYPGCPGLSYTDFFNYDQCPPCFGGIPGDPGYKGTRGPRGLPGDQGCPGQPGTDGYSGDAGPPGERGLPGEKGPDGEDGLHGEDGYSYKSELTGEKGPPGCEGLQGDPGPPGERGEDGPRGYNGPQGLVGYPGLSGKDGPLGLPGRKGNPGQDANYCPCPPREEDQKLKSNDVQETYQAGPTPVQSQNVHIQVQNHPISSYFLSTTVPYTLIYVPEATTQMFFEVSEANTDHASHESSPNTVENPPDTQKNAVNSLESVENPSENTENVQKVTNLIETHLENTISEVPTEDVFENTASELPHEPLDTLPSDFPATPPQLELDSSENPEDGLELDSDLEPQKPAPMPPSVAPPSYASYQQAVYQNGYTIPTQILDYVASGLGGVPQESSEEPGNSLNLQTTPYLPTTQYYPTQKLDYDGEEDLQTHDYAEFYETTPYPGYQQALFMTQAQTFYPTEAQVYQNTYFPTLDPRYATDEGTYWTRTSHYYKEENRFFESGSFGSFETVSSGGKYKDSVPYSMHEKALRKLLKSRIAKWKKKFTKKKQA